jgi:hypothetical protein
MTTACDKGPVPTLIRMIILWQRVFVVEGIYHTPFQMIMDY